MTSNDTGPRGELARLREEHEAAARRYGEALSALDRGLRRLPDFPHPPPQYDEAGLFRLEALREIAPAAPSKGRGWRGGVRGLFWRLLAPLVERQQAFNAAVVDHLTRNAASMRETPRAVASTIVVLRDEVEGLVTFQSRLLQFLQRLTPVTDTRARVLEHEIARLRATAAVAHRAASAASHEIERLVRAGPAATADRVEPQSPPARAPAGDRRGRQLERYKYVAFEDLHRGSTEELRARLQDYLPSFEGRGPVLEIGCGRGEFLELLRERGIAARGVDTNDEMVRICRERDLDVERIDGLAYLESLAPNSLGGLFAAQVVEHLEPEYLLRLLDIAADRLRPDGVIVLETINPACWVAFFESYIRDPTHVRPLHPDTLAYLLVASGFADVDVSFRSPVAQEARLETVAPPSTPGAGAGELDALVTAFNANVARLNSRLFTYLDYAVVGRRA